MTSVFVGNAWSYSLSGASGYRRNFLHRQAVLAIHTRRAGKLRKAKGNILDYLELLILGEEARGAERNAWPPILPPVFAAMASLMGASVKIPAANVAIANFTNRSSFFASSSLCQSKDQTRKRDKKQQDEIRNKLIHLLQRD